MLFIREEIEIPATAVLVEESSTGKKKMYLEGTFLQSAIKNRNGRIYPESVMDKEVARYIKEVVNTNKAWGELNHPDTPRINPERVSHRITELHKSGTDYVGKAVIGEEGCGRTVRGLLEMGGNIGVSSRALGSIKVNSQGINEVQDDFRLSTAADVVLDPSGPDCWVNGIMEGVEWFYNEATGTFAQGQITELAVKEIENLVATRSLNEETMLASFQRFLSRLSK